MQVNRIVIKKACHSDCFTCRWYILSQGCRMKKIVFIASNHIIRRYAVQIFSRVLRFTLFLANIFTYICILYMYVFIIIRLVILIVLNLCWLKLQGLFQVIQGGTGKESLKKQIKALMRPTSTCTLKLCSFPSHFKHNNRVKLPSFVFSGECVKQL